MPEPPARIRSASVPCGVSSTSSSPERYWRANSLFSPTYDEIIRRSRLAISSRPRPQSSTPQLFETASGRRAGLQQRVDQHRRDPAQPEAAHRERRTRLAMSATASAALATTLSTCPPRLPRTRPSSSAPVYGFAIACPPAPTVRLARRPAAHRDRQGRHRQVHGRRGPRPRARVPRQDRAALRGRGAAGHRPAVRRAAAAYEERRIAHGSGRDGGDVYALAIDPESALLEYLAMYYRLGRAGKALDRFGVIDFATTIAPGVRDVLLTGKVYEAANRNAPQQGRPAVRRRRARRAADRPDRPVPQRQRRAGRAGEGRPDQVARPTP